MWLTIPFCCFGKNHGITGHASHWQLYFDHVFDAELADPDPGTDNIGIRFSHRF